MRAVIALVASGAVVWATATATAAAPRAQCAPTPNSGGGPDRGPIALRAKIGRGHVLTGIVLSPTCGPIRGARVSFWQSNANGVYTTAGRGAVLTDSSGRFRFEGPMPVAYDGRPAHIHLKVQARDYETLYTEYEPHGRRVGSIRLVLVPAAL